MDMRSPAASPAPPASSSRHARFFRHRSGRHHLLKDMQTDDLLAEIELWEREPELQRCVLSEHDQAGQVFNLIHGCT
jgi:hypothetical protein